MGMSLLIEREESGRGACKVRNGHPWETKKLRRLRRQQRRLLRALPSTVIAGLHAPRPAIALEGDGVIVELELRRRARECVEREGADDLLDELGSKFPQTLLVETLQKTEVPATADFALTQLAPPDTTPELGDGNVHAALQAFATLVVMADRLSDDGYLDPRVR
jgi:hypothetical protein